MNASRTFKNAAYAHLAQVGKALSSAARLEILDLLAQGSADGRGARAGDRAVGRQHVASPADPQAGAARRGASQRLARRVRARRARRRAARGHAAGGRGRGTSRGVEQLTRAYFEARDGLDAVDRETLLDKLARDEVVLVDVRPEHEFEAGHVAGALSIPHDQLESRLAELPAGCRDRRLLPRAVLHVLRRRGPTTARPRLRRPPHRRLRAYAVAQ